MGGMDVNDVHSIPLMNFQKFLLEYFYFTEKITGEHRERNMLDVQIEELGEDLTLRCQQYDSVPVLLAPAQCQDMFFGASFGHVRKHMHHCFQIPLLPIRLVSEEKGSPCQVRGALLASV